MAKLNMLVFDSLHPAGLARFWAAVLDEYDIRPYDRDELERLAAAGLSPDTDPQVAVDGPGPTLFFQQVQEPKNERNRLHLDVEASDRSAEVKRLLELGAAVRDEHEDLTVMLDPEGNEFCVVQTRRTGSARGAAPATGD